MTKEEDLSSLFDAASKTLAENAKEVQSATEKNVERLGRDRSWIIMTYLVAVLGAIVFLIVSVPECIAVNCPSATESWDKQAELLKDLIVTAVVGVAGIGASEGGSASGRVADSSVLTTFSVPPSRAGAFIAIAAAPAVIRTTAIRARILNAINLGPAISKL